MHDWNDLKNLAGSNWRWHPLFKRLMFLAKCCELAEIGQQPLVRKKQGGTIEHITPCLCSTLHK